MSWIVHASILLPLLFAALPLLQARSSSKFFHVSGSIASSLLILTSIVWMLVRGPGSELALNLNWIGAFSLHYDLLVSGWNIPTLLLIAIAFPTAVGCLEEKNAPGGFRVLLLGLQSVSTTWAMADDLLLVLFCMGAWMVPAYFMHVIWDSSKSKGVAVRALSQQVLALGLFFLAAMIVFFEVVPHTFTLQEVRAAQWIGGEFSILGQDITGRTLAFWLVSACFSLLLPIFPVFLGFRTRVRSSPPALRFLLLTLWVPLLMQTFLRFGWTLFPDSLMRFQPFFLALGGISGVLGAFYALGAVDLRDRLSGGAMSWVGVLLMGGVTQDGIGLAGALVLILTGGLAFAGLSILAERSTAGESDAIPGIGWHQLGWVVFWFGLLAIPGAAGFAGQVLVLMGVFAVAPAWIIWILLAGLLLLAAGVVGQRDFNERFNLRLKGNDSWILGGFFVAMLVLAVAPLPILSLIRPAVKVLLDRAGG